MLVGVDHATAPDPANKDQYEAEAPEEVDPATLAPLCGEEEFTELMDEMVANEAPRLFAVVQEYGERVDFRIAAWGMAFEHRAEVISVEGNCRMKLQRPERALRGYAWNEHITPHLVWVNPDAATLTDETGVA